MANVAPAGFVSETPAPGKTTQAKGMVTDLGAKLISFDDDKYLPGEPSPLPRFPERSWKPELSHGPLSRLACVIVLSIVAPMRPLRALALYIAVVFIGGALLAPWLYWLAQTFAHTFPRIANSPFHRFVNRSLLGLALIGIWPLLKSLGVDSPREGGLVGPVGNWKRLAGGFLFGLVSLAIVAGFALAAGTRRVNPMISPAVLGEKVVGIALTAGVVAVLEEILFRGAVFGALRKVFHWAFALVLSSMIYAIVHFMEPAKLIGTVTWLSGLELLPRMLGGFTNLHAIFPGFLNLTLAGILLGWAYQRTGDLYFSIGLHAGWIFWLKSYGALTAEVPGATTWWWGTSRLIDGWFALPVLAVTLRLFLLMPIGPRKGRPA